MTRPGRLVSSAGHIVRFASQIRQNRSGSPKTSNEITSSRSAARDCIAETRHRIGDQPDDLVAELAAALVEQGRRLDLLVAAALEEHPSVS